MEEEAVERLVGELAETRRHFDVVAEGMHSELRQLSSDVKSDIEQARADAREDFAEARRHSEVIAEGLRSDIRQVAEGVAAVTSGMQDFRSEIKQELTELRSMIRLSYAELDRRLQTLEKAVVSLDERVQRLENVA